MNKRGSYSFAGLGAKARSRELRNLKEGKLSRDELRWMKRILRGVSSPKIADLGSGAGNCTKEIADFLPNARVVGLEPDGKLCRHARELYRDTANLSFRRICSGHLLTAAREAFDLITSRLVFHHVADPVHELAGIFGALKPGGAVWIFTLDVSTFRLEPWDPTLRRYWEKILRIRKQSGGNPLGCAQLPALLHKAGFTGIEFLSSSLSCTPVERSCLKPFFSRWLNSLNETEQAAAECALEKYLERHTGTGALCFSPFVFSLIGRKPCH